MTMTPQDIQSKQFHVRFRGFDVEEVDEYLEQVAEQYMMLEEENKTLQVKVDTLQDALDGLKVEESSFKDAIISAQKVAEEMKNKSRIEAENLIIQAHEEVKNLKDEANREITELEYRVDELSGMQGKLQTELKSTIAKYLEQIDETFVSTVIPYVPGEVTDREAEPQSYMQGVDVDEVVKEHQTVDLESESEQEHDLSDLYEKIDLDSITEPHNGEMLGDTEPLDDELEAGGISVSDITDKLPSLDLDQDDETMLPDLDDEVVFTLDDPLDIEDIDMPIAAGESGKADK